MHATLRRFAAASLFASAAALGAQSGGSPDPAFAAIPFDRWIDEGDQAHIHWTAKALPVELSNHQRLEAKVEIVLDGNELVRRRGKGYMAMLVQFTDSQDRVYQTHQALDLQLVKEDTGKSNISYTRRLLSLPATIGLRSQCSTPLPASTAPCGFRCMSVRSRTTLCRIPGVICLRSRF